MHPSSYQRCQEFVQTYLDKSLSLRIADVGSYDINGTYRRLLECPRWSYTGFDAELGGNVDVVLNSPEDWRLEPQHIGTYDVVVSGQVLAHVRRPWLWIQQLTSLVRPGGLVWVCVPNTWGYHEIPIDCWRIWPEGLKTLLADAGVDVLECRAVGPDTFGIGRRPKSEVSVQQASCLKNPGANSLIDVLYAKACQSPSDIFQHLPVLREFAARCEKVTEFGTRNGISTTALLAGRPRQLTCYDIRRSNEIDLLAEAAREVGVDFRFLERSTSVAGLEIEDTDLLFIDTLHTYNQLLRELRLHAHHARRYLAFHDFTSFGLRDEVDQNAEFPGLLPAFFQFLAESNFVGRVAHYSPANNGLLVLERSPAEHLSSAATQRG